MTQIFEYEKRNIEQAISYYGGSAELWQIDNHPSVNGSKGHLEKVLNIMLDENRLEDIGRSTSEYSLTM